MLYVNAHIVIFIFILLLIDLYAFQAFRSVSKGCSHTANRWINTLYWLISCFFYVLIILTQYTDWHGWNIYFRTYSIGFLIILITSKIVLALFVFVDDVVRFFRWLFMKISYWFKKRESKETIRKDNYLSRSEFIIRTGLIIGSIPFFSMIYGMAFNPYNYKVRKLRLILPCPSGFI